MKSSIQCAFCCTAQSPAALKTMKTGRDYLALTVAPLDNAEERILVSAFHNFEGLPERIKPQQTLYIEGTIKIVRWEKDGIPQAAQRVTAEVIQPMFDVDAKPKPRAKTAKTGKPADAPTTPAPAELPLAETSDETLGRGTGQKSAAGLAQGPAAQKSGATYERPFNDRIDDLF